jgi:hypothetical protein
MAHKKLPQCTQFEKLVEKTLKILKPKPKTVARSKNDNKTERSTPQAGFIRL